jgi:hypothetical protein
MLAMLNENYGKVVDIERFTSDGRLTEHSDGKVFDYRKMLESVKMLGRPLTDKEAEIYRIK